jgi:hypothetical protein
MVRSMRLVHDNRSEDADQRVEQRSLSKDDVSKLAEVMAELTYLDHLEARRESNVTSLKRLKEACDALLESGLVTLSSALPPDPPPAKDEPVDQ